MNRVIGKLPRPVLAGGALGVLLSANALAAPRLLPFQARLTDATGTPLPDGARLVQFQIYGEPTGGTPLWAGEVHRLTLNGGLVNVMLGSRNPLPADRPDDPSRSFFDATLYLQITPDANADEKLTDADPPLLPRQAVVPVVFAQESAVARTVVDGAITANKLAQGAVTTSQLAAEGVTVEKLASEVVRRLAPAGSVVAFAGDTAQLPAGWLLCDGSAVSRTQYAALFQAIGTAWGTGDELSTFNLPDLRGVFLRGVNGLRNDPLADPDRDARTEGATAGSSAGNRVGSFQAGQMPQHEHFIMNGDDLFPESAPSFYGGGATYLGPVLEGGSLYMYSLFGSTTYPDRGRTSRAGQGTESRPPNAYVHYLIKY